MWTSEQSRRQAQDAIARESRETGQPQITKEKHRVTGNKSTGFAVLDGGGGTLYDLLDNRQEANAIRDILNDGIGPEWDAVSEELERRKQGEPWSKF